VEINDFLPFPAGTVFNKLDISKSNVYKPLYKSVCIEYPTRLNAMAIDPSGIVENHNMKYSPGEIVFSTDLFIKIEVSLTNGNTIVYIGDPSRKSIVKHACKIMQQAFSYDGGFKVDIKEIHEFRHCGLGSTGALQSAIAAAINYMFGEVIEPNKLVKYLAQNYGEEIEGDEDFLMPVQCIGGSAASGLYKGGVLVIAGENTVIATGNIGAEYDVIIGIPEDFEFTDSQKQFEKEKKNLYKFLNSGNKYKYEIAYNVLHHFLPAVVEGNVRKMGDVIFDYRYNKNSISNCSYTYPGLIQMMENLKYLKTENFAEVLTISSVGPTVFAITRNKKICVEAFKRNNLKVIKAKIYNGTFRINECKKA